MIGILSVWGMPSSTFMRKTVRESMVEMAKVIFSPDSAGIRNTHLKEEICVVRNHFPMKRLNLHFAHIVFLYSQSKDVDKESRGKKVEPIEHWSSPYLDEVPEQVEVDTVQIEMAVFKII